MHLYNFQSWCHDKHLPIAETWSISLGFVLLTSTGLVLAILSAWYPLLGFIAFTLVHRGVYRYTSDGAWLHHSGIVYGVLLLSMTGWFLWRIQDGKPLKAFLRKPIVCLTLSFMVWIVFVEIIAQVHHPEYVPFLLRNWLLGIGVLAFTLMGIDVTSSLKDLLVIAFGLVAIIFYRSIIMTENVWLDEELAHLAVTTMPLLATTLAFDAWFVGLTIGVFCCGFLTWTLIRTHNRGGYVGLLASIVVTPIAFPRRFGLPLLIAGIALAGGIVRFYPGYLQRFTEIFYGGRGAETFKSRFEIYDSLLKEIPQNQWFGIGMGRTGYLVSKNAPSIGFKNAHNSWLSNVVEFGIPGAICFNLIVLFGVYHSVRLIWSIGYRNQIAGGAILCFYASYLGISLGHTRDFYESLFIVTGIAAALSDRVMTDSP
jgi:O-antigen ligase